MIVEKLITFEEINLNKKTNIEVNIPTKDENIKHGKIMFLT